MKKFSQYLEEKSQGLWANIHAKRARGEKMRKKGEKGAPTPEAIKSAQKENANYHKGLSKATADKRKAHFAKGAKMDDDNPAAYKPAPGDATAKTKPSKHTLKYKKMYGEGVEQIDEKVTAALQKKAQKSGMSLSTLRKVYNRGVAAWRTGHRPGTTPSQWGMARVNSYITKGKGTYHGADKDLRGK